MSDYTPGPWCVTSENGFLHIRAADTTSLMCNETFYPWVPNNINDWYLIAAAPDLLEALEDALQELESMSYLRYNSLEQKMRAAIAKAKGKS